MAVIDWYVTGEPVCVLCRQRLSAVERDRPGSGRRTPCPNRIPGPFTHARHHRWTRWAVVTPEVEAR